MKLLKRLLTMAGPLNGVLAASILAGLIATTAQTGLLWATFNVLFQPEPHLWLTILVLALIGGLTRFSEQYLGHLAAFKILARLRNLTYAQMMRLAPAKLDDAHSSDVLKLLAQDIDQIEIFYAHTLAPVILGAITSVGFTVWFWQVNPLLGLIALAAYVLIGLVYPLLSQRRLTELAPDLGRADLKEQRLMADAVTGKATLQQFQAVNQHLTRLDQTTRQFWSLDRTKATRQTLSGLAMQLTMVLGLAAFIVVVKMIHAPFVWAVIFPFTLSRVLALGNLPGSLSGGLLAAKHVFALLDEVPVAPATGQEPINTLAEFGLNAVDFAYPQRPSDQVLKQTALTVTPGERVGLIGPSGAGKSTIMKLVMRWYIAQGGTVTVNQQDTTTYDLAQLRQTMAYVPQNAQLFAGSLRENLTLRTRMDDERLWEVLDWLDLQRIIMRLPDQLDTLVDRQRPVLSAGEVQRLELARALLSPSSLLILDEPTSNLDVVNEALILKAVKQHYHGTVVLVTHRHSSLALCDRVLELRDGRLAPVATS
ncbi:amino acid ABC transporter ATP-binding/permease protein [Lactiplantibacillus carotarum]|uniref:amino acid ABC transporter ATP-binding/permease protein n=1 Tax=Lactiplantibacillus carotarum TaxID=2993456 RepID=UPI00298ED8FA|nr:ABC transporter ATP-binding protein [Lactiplantibacillus carotarum]